MSCYRLIEAEKAHHGVSLLCRVLGVSRAGFYAWQSRPPSARAVADQAVTAQIQVIHSRSRGTYGASRVHAELRLDQGVRVSRKRVARLMRTAGLVGCPRRDPRPPRPRTWSVATSPPSGRTRSGAADITYIPTWSGWLYLAVVLDVFSRRVVGWAWLSTSRPSWSSTPSTWPSGTAGPTPGWSIAATRLPIHLAGLRPPPAPGRPGRLHGVGRRLLRQRGHRESFFATLECELLDRTRFATRTQARTAVFDYLEGFCNRIRRHSTLGYLSPADFERRHTTSYPAARPC